MPNTDLSILVVDDAKFSSAVIGKTLRNAGFKDVRLASNAMDASKMMEARPVSLLIADWLMPVMDGLQLTSKVRQNDEATNHFTYIILLTAKEGPKVLAHAFDSGVDDFINKSVMNEQLLPRIYAADRISNIQNRLLRENELLVDANRKLKKYSTLDPLTGIGNKALLETCLQSTIKHCTSRGGCLGILLISINDFADIKRHHSKTVVSQLILGVSRRLRQLVRPLDTITRIAVNEFAIITTHSNMEYCQPTHFRRVYDGINLKAYKTSSGYISIDTAIALCVTDCQDEQPPYPEDIIAKAREMLPESKNAGRVIGTFWDLESI